MSGLVSQADRRDTHDLGFVVFLPFAEQYRLTGSAPAKATVLRAATSLASRYSETVGATRSWNTRDGSFRVIVDNLVNLELLFWAARNGGDPALRDMARRHALTSLREHVRADGSTYHVVDFDPATGAVTRKASCSAPRPTSRPATPTARSRTATSTSPRRWPATACSRPVSRPSRSPRRSAT